MKVLLTGSLAYDQIMDFPGKFSDHILPDKIHILNVSFLVEKLERQFGGTAGNIAYNLSLLGINPVIFACAGKDFGPYKKWLEKNRIDTRPVKIMRNENTAVAHIVTDQQDNQITAFYPGALKHGCALPTQKDIRDSVFAVVSPTNILDMVAHAKHYKKMGLRYMFDPGQQITALKKMQLHACITGAAVLIVNDYELSLVLHKLSMTRQKLLSKVKILVTTLGERGSVIEGQQGKITIPAARPKTVVDPTGAGDAYRAGFIAGLVQKKPLEKAGRMGSILAVYALERYGTQEHRFTIAEFKRRYKKNFGHEL